MDTSEIVWIGGAIVVAIVGWLLFQTITRNFLFSKAREFEYDGVMFWWIPERKPSWFSNAWEYGRFEYHDGTPVKDARLHREIYAAWESHQRYREGG